MSWTLALQAIETAAVTAGVVFALVQLRHLRVQREVQGGIELLRPLQAPGNAEVLMLIYQLPDNLDGKELRKRLGKNFGAALSVLDMFESLGPLVARGHVPIEMYSEFYRGITVLCWRKTRRYIEEERKLGWPNFYEWLQWLAERIEERSALSEDMPAFERFRRWRSSADFDHLAANQAPSGPTGANVRFPPKVGIRALFGFEPIPDFPYRIVGGLDRSRS